MKTKYAILKSTLLCAILLFPLLQSFGQGEWTTTYLSESKYLMGVTTLGTKVYFGGGYTPFGTTDKVEIYDTKTGEWTYSNLSEPRRIPDAVSCGSKVFFAGGVYENGLTSSTVDIFDTITQQWTTAQLSQARFGMGVLSKGNKVLFAGGSIMPSGPDYNVVDIFDVETGIWTTASLSEARNGFGATIAGDFALFAGGYSFSNKITSNKVDLYQFSTGNWFTATLSTARFLIGATTVGDLAIFAGGIDAAGTPTDQVDIYNVETNTWSVGVPLSVARGFMQNENAATVFGIAYFTGGVDIETENYSFTNDYDEIDIYDVANGNYTTTYLPFNLFAHSTIANGNQLLIAGGGTIFGEFIQLRDQVSIYSCTTVGIHSVQTAATQNGVYPNPASSEVNITYLLTNASGVSIHIYNVMGQKISGIEYGMLPAGKHLEVLDVSTWNPGVYYGVITTSEGRGKIEFAVMGNK